jgi:hypothetical protein
MARLDRAIQQASVREPMTIAVIAWMARFCGP